MSGKYMKVKRVIIPTITMLVIASQLFGCSSASKQEAYDMIQESTEIELEYAVPEYDTTEESKIESLSWIQLSSLETHPELRKAFEEYVGITGTTGNKQGSLYTNSSSAEYEQNTTLLMAIKNLQFRELLSTPESLSKFGEIAVENYTDVELDDLNAPYTTINAYFELLPDETEGQSDCDSTITRAQAMALLMRATTQVTETGVPETDIDFTTAVGESQYTDFAAAIDEYAYINISNGLTESTFNTAISKGEFIYLVTNCLYSDNDLNADISEVTIYTVSDAGDISFSEAISDSSKGVPSDMYENFQNAISMNLITEDDLEDWDSAITRGEAVRMFTTMAINCYQTTEQTSSVNSTSDNVILSDDEYKGDDPRDTGTTDTAKTTETTETTELEGVDLDGDGKISQSEADFYKELYEEVSAIVDKELGSGSTSNNSSIPHSGNHVGSGVVDGTIEGSTGSAPGQGDCTGAENAIVY